ncbi:Putative flippase GtrA (transmembrane translocase of bactoprenol-linked glucose) [Mucilaginibacter mallensis]|uniref:Putative flippase GtrA (Transmembrane translocase of bactoprenol-linked glucose) n=1 Tax=Mucilaginibacter mallensis TaxID=652787 RepID=A0A1H1ZBE5_MUCMA|nr:GtrA family protein [Mucilaginibacter mallensis]SDT30953.1 Putative flippase GtrA (transmembrane translocase of bactoprenol-linked glucose) [Mucilaginibacter mallensis]
MSTFIKAQASSIIATLFDFLTTIVCKEFFYFWYVIASLLGTIVGGVTNFALGRNWVFNRKEKKIPMQVLKYLIIWNGNLLLSTLGVFIVTHYLGLSYIISKIIVSVTVGVTYNYLLQKRFVFA